jgi:CRP/FNR family transcriptional regulator, cyclic AMP receptor protein
MTTPSNARRRVIPAGTVLFEEGAVGKEAYIVEYGRVSIYKTVDGQRIPLGDVGDGGIFGEMALIDDQPRMASAVTVDETACVVVGKQHLGEQLDLAPRGVRVMVGALLGSIRLLGAELAEARVTLSLLDSRE